MKKIEKTLIIAILLTATVCGAQEKTAKVKPPRMNLHVAAIQGNLKAVQQHVAAGSDLNLKEPDAGST